MAGSESVRSEEIPIDSAGIITVTDKSGTRTYVMDKPSFAQKHPKLHKAGRKLRRTCQVLLPVVQFMGGVAQIATAVR